MHQHSWWGVPVAENQGFVQQLVILLFFNFIHRDRTMQSLLKTFPVVVKIPVIWGDMDSFQHVNNVIYFRYFESARIHYFETLGWMDIMGKRGVGPILGSTSCSYRIPLSYPDTAFVGAKITEMHEKRFTYGISAR